MINCSIFDCDFDHALCDLGASVNIMPKVTFEKLSYPADSTVRYPEGVMENLLVKVRNNFILADFVVLDIERDLGIPLIIGQSFLRDANARIDVGAGKVNLRVMGKIMRFKFQNKRELFLIHEDSRKQGLWAEPGWENWDIHHSPSEPAWEDWEIHDPPTNPVADDQKIPDFITNTV